MPNTNHRKNLRLPKFDYPQNGAYFITIVTQRHKHLFGEVVNGEMVLNDAGKMVEQVCREIPQIIPAMEFDIFQIMPNHFHGLMMVDYSNVGADLRVCPCQDGQPQRVAPTPPKGSLPNIIQRFKSLTTTRYTTGVRQFGWSEFEGRLWQRNYYEHVILDEIDHLAIYDYILTNPLNWEMDEER